MWNLWAHLAPLRAILSIILGGCVCESNFLSDFGRFYVLFGRSRHGQSVANSCRIAVAPFPGKRKFWATFGSTFGDVLAPRITTIASQGHLELTFTAFVGYLMEVCFLGYQKHRFCVDFWGFRQRGISEVSIPEGLAREVSYLIT